MVRNFPGLSALLFLAAASFFVWRISGWWKLSGPYRTFRKPDGTWFLHQYSEVRGGGITYLDVCITSKGLYLAGSNLFRMIQLPVLLPWDRIALVDAFTIAVGSPSATTIQLPPKVLLEIRPFLPEKKTLPG